MGDILFAIGALSAGFAVFVGGARAHVLPKILPSERMPMLEVGMRYQLGHAIGVMIASLGGEMFGAMSALLAGWVLLIGSLGFAGCMYCYACLGVAPLLKCTPVFGVLLVLGWLCLSLAPMGL